MQYLIPYKTNLRATLRDISNFSNEFIFKLQAKQYLEIRVFESWRLRIFLHCHHVKVK